MPFPFNFERILAPISGSNPAGRSLRFEGVYDKIRNARKEDDPTLPQGVWKTELKKAHWDIVESVAVDALENESKDIQIAAWLTEAWLKRHGFAGMARGLELIRRLGEQYWDDMFPAIENGDLDFRLAPLVWLNEKLPQSLKLTPFTQPSGNHDQPHSMADWELAVRNETVALRAGSGKAPNTSETAAIRRSAQMTPGPLARATIADLADLIAQANALDSFVDAKAGPKSPGLRGIVAVAEGICAFLADNTAPLTEESVLKPESNDGSPVPDVAVQSVPPLLPSQISDRAEAYMMLAAAADFLARTEPHSPTPYLVRRAIAWGSMNLEQLLPEMIRNKQELQEILSLLQIGQ